MRTMMSLNSGVLPSTLFISCDPLTLFSVLMRKAMVSSLDRVSGLNFDVLARRAAFSSLLWSLSCLF